MNCKQCGKTMPDGARFCISCGAEHDANGQLVYKNAPVDYNKTMMANDSFIQNGSGSKVDYNKTMMANDSFIQQGRGSKVDYNKTMMANDAPQVNQSKNMNGRTNNNGKVNKKEKSQKKKVSPVLIIVLLILLVAVIFKVILPMFKKSDKKVEVNESVVVESSETQQVIEETGNVVSDFDASDGYWSKDAEFFYKDGTVQRNQWIGDFYLGDNGRKVRNKLIDDTYYVDANGKKLKNQWYRFTKKIDGKEVVVWYYMGPDGAKLRDTFTPDGYYVDINGVYIPKVLNDTPDSSIYEPSN